MLITDELLLDHQRCDRRSYLNVYGDMTQKDPEREFVAKLRSENHRHINQILAQYHWHSPHTPKADWRTGTAKTLDLMAAGVDCIYQGCLSYTLTLPNVASPITLVGHPTLLVKRPGQSDFGDWVYCPMNVKLGKRPKTEYKMIAALHGYLLQFLQGTPPPQIELRLKGGKRYTVDFQYWLSCTQKALQNLIQQLQDSQPPEVFISRQRCGLCHWQSYCHQVAQQDKHLSLVPGVTPYRYEVLQGLGVQSVEELAELVLPPEHEELEPLMALQLKLQAQAIVENRAIAFPPELNKIPPIPLDSAPIELYFDLEAEPDRNVDYLFGVLCVNHQTQEERFFAFLAEHPEEEALIWQQFLALLKRYPTAPIFHFSEYEVETVKRLTKLYKNTAFPINDLISRFVDIHYWIVNSATLPVENYSLKTLAKWLGFRWRDQEVSGDQTVCLYDKWLTYGDRTFLETIIRYNEDDCRATYRLKSWLEQFLQEQIDCNKS